MGLENLKTFLYILFTINGLWFTIRRMVKYKSIVKEDVKTFNINTIIIAFTYFILLNVLTYLNQYIYVIIICAISIIIVVVNAIKDIEKWIKRIARDEAKNIIKKYMVEERIQNIIKEQEK